MGVLDGKVALVTGGARGIGQAIAVEFARCGADVVFCDICDPELAAGTLSAIRQTGQSARYFRTSVADRLGLELLFKDIGRLAGCGKTGV